MVKDILLVDDETPFVNSLVEGLCNFAGNVNIITADNGRKAMEMLRTVSVDLVITDLKMPVVDGFELVKYIREKHPKTIVIVMSMLDGAEVKKRLEELGVAEFLEKPIDFRTIMNRIVTA